MNRVGINGRIVLLMIILTTVEGTGSVSFWRDTVTLYCPFDGEGWYKDKVVVDTSMDSVKVMENDKISLKYEENKKQDFSCKYKDSENKESYFHFIFKGKGCENCFELDASLVAMLIVGDLLLTGGVILIVYLWAQKKSGPAAPQKPTSQSGGRAPAVPHPDYEPLRPGNRSKDIYATHRNG